MCVCVICVHIFTYILDIYGPNTPGTSLGSPASPGSWWHVSPVPLQRHHGHHAQHGQPKGTPWHRSEDAGWVKVTKERDNDTYRGWSWSVCGICLWLFCTWSFCFPITVNNLQELFWKPVTTWWWPWCLKICSTEATVANLASQVQPVH